MERIKKIKKKVNISKDQMRDQSIVMEIVIIRPINMKKKNSREIKEIVVKEEIAIKIETKAMNFREAEVRVKEEKTTKRRDKAMNIREIEEKIKEKKIIKREVIVEMKNITIKRGNTKRKKENMMITKNQDSKDVKKKILSIKEKKNLVNLVTRFKKKLN